MPGPGQDCQPAKVRPKQVFNFIGYQYDLTQGLVRPSPEMGSPELKNRNPPKTETVHSETVHVSTRPSHYH